MHDRGKKIVNKIIDEMKKIIESNGHIHNYFRYTRIKKNKYFLDYTHTLPFSWTKKQTLTVHLLIVTYTHTDRMPIPCFAKALGQLERTWIYCGRNGELFILRLADCNCFLCLHLYNITSHGDAPHLFWLSVLWWSISLASKDFRTVSIDVYFSQ